MHSILALSALPAFAAAATHMVKVGDGGLKFVPETITAAKGDTVQFMWTMDHHSVTQGDPQNACSPSGSDGFYSGEVDSGHPTWTIEINSTDPIYYYCAVNSHCQLGMVGGINVPSIDSYKTAANMAGQNVPGAKVQGGSFDTTSGGSSSSSSSMSGSMSSSTMSGSSSMSMSSSVSMTSSMSMSMSSTMASGSSSATPASASSASSSSSHSGAAPTHFVAAIVAGLPAAVAALL